MHTVNYFKNTHNDLIAKNAFMNTKMICKYLVKIAVLKSQKMHHWKQEWFTNILLKSLYWIMQSTFSPNSSTQLIGCQL